MQKLQFGPLRDKVARIGQGTWHIETGDRRRAIDALRRGMDLGLTHIDTAEMYGSGAAERIVGEAIAGRRDEVFLVSKVLPGNASREGTVEACEKSLARLGTDRLDCYVLHWRGRYPLEDTIEAFEKLREAGKIRSWGVSNFDVDDLDEAWRIVGPDRMACNQVLYHLQERAIEHAVIPWCAAHGVAVVAYSPFGSGQFPKTGLNEIAKAHGATPRQVALSYLLRWPSVFAIPKAANLQHVEENAGAASVVLTQAEIAKIDAAFPLGRRPRSLPML
jgi:diketogulonate reductase-like aldo/keto reductase